MIFHFAIFFILTKTIVSQKATPCPGTFSYEPMEPGDRWYGVVKYSSPQDVTGIWLHVTLDTPADILGNWFGRVTTQDNTVYDIRRPDYILKAGVTLNVRFFVKYNLAQTIPSLVTIKLNGKTICEEGERVERRPTTPKPPTTRPPNVEVFKVQQKPKPTRNKSPGPTRPNNPGQMFATDDSDPNSEYPGDYSVLATSRAGTGSARLRLLDTPTCGIIAPKPTSEPPTEGETWRGQWPWHAALYRSKGANLLYICAATLVDPQHVVAPAHCVTRFHTNLVNQPNNFIVSLGKYSLKRFETDIQDTVVAGITIHPQYNHTIFINDIAVLKLTKPIKLTDFVKPSCLWEDDLNLNKTVGKEGVIVGWGTDEQRKLKQTKMNVVPIGKCVSHSLPDTYYCAEFKNDNSSCNIRSISGMLMSKNGTSGAVWQLRGMNVFSEVQVSCDETNYLLFTDVAKYTPWISQVIAKDYS